MINLTGKVAIVTGASKGIGAGISKELAKAGAAVVVNYSSSQEGADNTVAEITKNGGKAIAVKGSVSEREEVVNLFDEAEKAFGKVDILINNAGIFKFESLDEFTKEEFERQYAVNVLGPLLTTQIAARRFGPEGGSIVNVSSLVSTKAIAGSVIYSSTKGALDAITRVLAKELAPKKIRVNSVNPGVVETEGTHTAGFIGSDFEKGVVAETPLGRVGQPSDIAKVAVFLASDASGWMTGEHLVASGGFK